MKRCVPQLEALLLDLGCVVAGAADELNDALQMARTSDFDVALLDINLGGKRVDPVADAIRAREVLTGRDCRALCAGVAPFVLTLERSALTYLANEHVADADTSLVLTRDTLNDIALRLATIADVIQSGQIKVGRRRPKSHFEIAEPKKLLSD